jgi:dienelactone hydrolase
MNHSMRAIIILVALVSFHCKSENTVPRGGATSAARDASGAVSRGVAQGQTVTMTTSDNIVITGTLYSAGGSSAPAVLCLHQWRSDRGAFAGLADILSAEGITVLAIDMRGNGDSRKKTDGSRVEPDRMAVADVAAAVAFLQKSHGVDPTRIGIVGASYGSSNALLYAADHPGIKALALLSPGINYFNVLPTEPAVKSLKGTPVFAIASADDFRSVEAVTRYKEIMSESLKTELLKSAGHGTDMFQADPKILSVLASFFKKNL